MQMNSGASLQSEINVTPLVDVVLVLLIIFMVVVPLLIEGYDVGMPKTSAASSSRPPSEETQLVLGIVPETCPVVDPPPGEGVPSNCRVILAGQDIPASELPARAAQLLNGRPADQHVLFLAADDRMNYEVILRIVDMAKTGVDDLQIEFLTTD